MLVCKIRWPNFDLQRCEEHRIKEQALACQRDIGKLGSVQNRTTESLKERLNN